MTEAAKHTSNRNKTLTIGAGERERYLKMCASPAELATGGSAIDRVIVGDAFECANYLPRATFDLMIVDPPYNMTKDFGGDKFVRLNDEEYRKYTAKWLDCFLPLMKADATVYVCCDWKSSLIIADELSKRLKIRNRITWQREKGRGASRNWKNSMEDIWYATVTDEYTFNIDAVKQRKKVIAPYVLDGKARDWQREDGEAYRLTCPSNFWDDITVPFWSMKENTDHPTQKSEKLLAKLILASSDEGDVVFDPFGGSGSSAVTAKKLSRHFTTIEKNETYCAYAQARLERAEADKSIQGYRNGVFTARNDRQSR